MTFYESQKQIDENWKELDRHVIYSNPPHIIKGCFTAPTKRDHSVEQYIFTKCIDEAQSNEKVLFDLNLMTDQLSPFVAIQAWGMIFFIPLDSYLNAPWKRHDVGNNS